MKIDVFAVCYNEEKMIGYFLKHYLPFANVYIYDNNSTDNTVQIVKEMGGTVIPFSTNNQYDEMSQVRVRNNCWRQSTADWVIICDVDEFIYHPNLIKILEETNATLIIPEGYNMYSDTFPTTKGQIYDEIRFGIPDSVYSKPIIFKPSEIKDIQFGVGSHYLGYIDGNVISDSSTGIKLLHMKHLSINYLLERYSLYSKRMSNDSRQSGWGKEYLWEKEKVINLFNENFSNRIEVISQRKRRICYVINFYLGDRRFDIDTYNIDKLCYLKTQIETLSKYKHSLTKIIFNFNIEPSHYDRLNDAISLIPKMIQNTPVEIHIRKNIGISYGAFSDIFKKYQDLYDYYIFNEDDYVIVQDNFDDYLVNKFNSLPNCGYLCGLVRETSDIHAKHAGMSSGISSYTALKKVLDTYGELPHAKTGDYGRNEVISQVNQSNAFIQVGYEIYDIREDYRVQMKSAEKIDGHNVVHRYFMWHDKDLFLSTNIYLNEFYIWIDKIGTEYLRMESDINSTNYFKYGQ